jgi:asparagine synthase (glutamine-hydrolysing)
MTAGIKRLLSPEMQAELAGHDYQSDVAAMLPRGYEDFSPLGRWQWLEAAILLPGYILSTQGDRMAMAHGVEGRFPFLDHRVAELAARMPARWRMRGLQEKYLLRRATGDLLPEAIHRRPKQPYRAPDVNAFFDPSSGRARAEWIDAMVDPQRIAADGIFHAEGVRRLVEKARQGKATGTRDNMALVGVLSTQLLIEQFVHAPDGRDSHSDRSEPECSPATGAIDAGAVNPISLTPTTHS